MGHRQTARQAADRLGNVQKSPKVHDRLTIEERDWVGLLRDRLYEIANRPEATDE